MRELVAAMNNRGPIRMALTDAANCFFNYTQPTAANVAATISGLTISGC
jgi:hypothetical protein